MFFLPRVTCSPPPECPVVDLGVALALLGLLYPDGFACLTGMSHESGEPGDPTSGSLASLFSPIIFGFGSYVIVIYMN